MVIAFNDHTAPATGCLWCRGPFALPPKNGREEALVTVEQLMAANGQAGAEPHDHGEGSLVQFRVGG